MLTLFFSYLTEAPDMTKARESIRSTLQIAEEWKLIDKDESEDEI